MCGIIGYVGDRNVSEVLLKGLKRLEYRGYDSSGVALFGAEKIRVYKAAGKITEIEPLLQQATQQGVRGGIGHTRWATHGAPNTKNAHPHRVEDIVLVHNGIIENYREIQEMVMARGYQPQSETDSEMFAFLVHFEMEKGTDFVEAVRRSFSKISGSSSIVAMCERYPGVIVGVRQGSPLVVGHGGGLAGSALASDVQPLLDYTDTVTFLENGDMVVCKESGLEFIDVATGQYIQRASTKIEWSADRLDKNGYPHYMLKEIHEQSRTIRDTLTASFAEAGSGALPFEWATTDGLDALEKARRLTLVACGTSWHASLLGQYWIEQMAELGVDATLASEFRYRSPVLEKGQVVMGVSQSGETADTLAVIQAMKEKGVETFSITNVKGSSIARTSQHSYFTYAGPEIGVASTKAFTGQMLVLYILAGRLARSRAMADTTGQAMEHLSLLHRQLFELPLVVTEALESEGASVEAIRRAAKESLPSKGFFFMGRGYHYPLALEGALKLKEIAYVHAEGYAAGELKHGPIAMLDPDMTVVVIAPRDRWYEKTVSNLQEVKARGARIIAIGDRGDHKLAAMADWMIPLPKKASLSEAGSLDESLIPFVISPLLQLFSYEIAVHKGTDVDQPRNLAKSVTVE